MEALVAVGLAGNVVQFVQSAGSLISLANQIRDNGKPSCLPELMTLSNTLIGQAAFLRLRLKALSATLAEEDQNLLELTADCEEAGRQFIVYLGTLSNSSSLRIVYAVKVAVKYQWASPKIKAFIDRLDRLRSSLILATVLACRSSTEGNLEEILSHLKDIQRDHQTRTHLDASNRKEELKHLEENIERLTTAVQDRTSQKLQNIQDEMQICSSELLTLRKNIKFSEARSSHDDSILSWLDFRQSSWRYEGIDKAYNQTYEWVFDRHSFSAHLRENVNEPYFINGKAGSGKSTLLKFIYNHPKTREALNDWAETNELMILPFFFWNIGTTMQKSHLGMLRGLLHAALYRHPELIPAVFPKLYRNWESWGSGTEPEYIEVKIAFGRMIEKSRYLRLVILIDGIDEFEGDYREMSLFVRSLASHHVKVIVSSRPMNACLSSFAGCPTLRVQDLTKNDMASFVDGKLSVHESMACLVQQFPESARRLISEIVNKAEGVFLWVRLVVDLLIHGLDNGDNMDELHAKLTALPSGLRDLYRRMFESMDMVYQKESAVMFRLYEHWLKIADDQPLPGLMMWYAINNPNAVLGHTMGEMPLVQYKGGMALLVKRIKSRCCGLLELRYFGRSFDSLSDLEFVDNDVTISEIGTLPITYLHRTVHEFITTEEIWHEICLLTNDMQFSIFTRLASACLSAMKLATKGITDTHPTYVKIVAQLCAKVADKSPQQAYTYLMELDRTMASLGRAAGTVSKDTWDSSQHWSSQLWPPAPRMLVRDITLTTASIYTYAAEESILCDPMPIPKGLDYESRCAIVCHALASWLPLQVQEETETLQRKRRTLEYVLSEVMGCDGLLSNISLWHLSLLHCQRLQDGQRYLESAHLLKILLSATTYPWPLSQRPLDGVKAETGQPFVAGIVEPLTLLESLRHHLHKQGAREDIQLVHDIEQIVKEKATSDIVIPSLLKPSQIDRGTPFNPGRVKKSRRSKKKRGSR